MLTVASKPGLRKSKRRIKSGLGRADTSAVISITTLTVRVYALSAMFSRRLSPAFVGLCLFLGAFSLLAACDSVNTDNLSGVWVGTATFTADSILADQNLRIQADYTASFTFRITDDGGLITGTLDAAFNGTRTTTEAGQPSQTLTFDPTTPFTDEFFGTYIKPVLEMDVAGERYEENLWTFDISGSGADLDRFLTHNHTIVLADSSEFTFSIDSDDFFEMDYESSN